MHVLQSLRFSAALMACCVFMLAPGLAQTAATASQPGSKAFAALSPKAQECVTKLDPAGKLIFDAALPLMTPGKELRDVVKESTKTLVKSGKIKRDEAKESAKAAGKCIRIDSK